jgi:(2R)-sulfolactate sulfo-lyase subunit alpha
VKGRFWVHRAGDFVGVAVEDIAKGEDLTGVYMDSGRTLQVRSRSDIPLGHKISLREIKSGEKVIEYGEVIGAATKRIRAGELVHTRNLKTLRWA